MSSVCLGVLMVAMGFCCRHWGSMDVLLDRISAASLAVGFCMLWYWPALLMLFLPIHYEVTGIFARCTFQYPYPTWCVIIVHHTAHHRHHRTTQLGDEKINLTWC